MKRHSLLMGLAGAALLFHSPSLGAQPIDVQLGKPMPRFEKLKAGIRRYIRYRIGKDGVASPMDLQTKEVRFDQADGQRRLHIVQDWQGSASSLRLDSWFEDKTFRPLTHQRDRTKDGKTQKEGFRFVTGKVVGIADQPDNVRKDFEIAAPVPTFNFETDLETLQVLPFAKNAEFRIVFYHPGGGPPAPYTFKVAGEETINVAGAAIPCWIVTTDYNAPAKPVGKFWIAKGSQTVVRVVQQVDDGSSIVKQLLV